MRCSVANVVGTAFVAPVDPDVREMRAIPSGGGWSHRRGEYACGGGVPSNSRASQRSSTGSLQRSDWRNGVEVAPITSQARNASRLRYRPRPVSTPISDPRRPRSAARATEPPKSQASARHVTARSLSKTAIASGVCSACQAMAFAVQATALGGLNTSEPLGTQLIKAIAPRPCGALSSLIRPAGSRRASRHQSRIAHDHCARHHPG